MNAVEPSLIRVEADEATYNLHIILRFELEQAMLADEFPLEQLPEEWNRRMWDYLGIEVPNDTARRPAGRPLVGRLDRLLPDLRARQPDLRPDLGEGDGRPARPRTTDSSRASSRPSATGCASTCIGYGRKFTPGETLERVVGTSQIDPEPYVRYLREKLAAIYGIAATSA